MVRLGDSNPKEREYSEHFYAFLCELTAFESGILRLRTSQGYINEWYNFVFGNVPIQQKMAIRASLMARGMAGVDGRSIVP